MLFENSCSVAPEPLAIWNKELEGPESELFKEVRNSPVAAPEHTSGFFLGEFLSSKNSGAMYPAAPCFLRDNDLYWFGTPENHGALRPVWGG